MSARSTLVGASGSATKILLRLERTVQDAFERLAVARRSVPRRRSAHAPKHLRPEIPHTRAIAPAGEPVQIGIVGSRDPGELFDLIDEGFCVIELLFDAHGQACDYRFLQTNAAFERHTGLTNAVGKTVRELVPDLDESWFRLYGQVARTREAIRVENHAPAMARWFEVYAAPTGEPERHQVALVFNNITERKLAEQALRESEARAREAAARAESERGLLDAILAAAPVGIIVAEANGKIVRMNPANERLWGPAPKSDDVSGYRAWRGWWADGSERHGRLVEPEEWAMSRALRGETVREDVVEIEPFDSPPGTRRVMLNSGAPVRDASGNIIGAVIAQMDITARLEAEQALRESEQRFETLANNISQLAWMADETGSIFWFNQRWYDYTGTTFDQVKGDGWLGAHDPAELPRVQAGFRAAIATGRVWEDTFPLRSKDGEMRWFLSHAMPVRDEHGKVVRWFGTNTDIEEQRRQAAALKEAIQVRDTFLQIAAHELRTPLTALSLQLDGLERLHARSDNGGRRAGQKVATAIRQTARLSKLIEDLLDVSRITSGRLRLEVEPLDLVETTRETVERMRDMATRAGCDIRFKPRGTITGTWDRSRIDQVITNLLTNAIKYGTGRPIELTLEPRDGVAELCVHDHGIGIAPSDQQRIFERFERAVSASHYGGLGLGLYITREIVQAHGGSIEVRSAPGGGATFVVTLPISARTAVQRSEEGPRSEALS